jgi:hypothetical protein
MKKITLFIILLFFIFFPKVKIFAFDLDELKKCACEGVLDNNLVRGCLNEAKSGYLKENRYSEFVELLKSLCPNKEANRLLNYNIALARYEQLKYLEESKGWDEYFAMGNNYRNDIAREAGLVIISLPEDSRESLEARLLLYRFHKDQQDSFVEDALLDLMASAQGYAKFGDDPSLLKEVADTLFSYQESFRSKEAYRLYVALLTRLDIKDEELKKLAVQFYQEGNLELAENIYDTYMTRINDSFLQEDILKELKEVARLFSYKDSGHYDLDYAESIFQKIEDIDGIDAFDEDLIYMRGFNLEKNKSFEKTKNIYLMLLKDYPESRYAQEVIFKLGVIFTYALRDPKEGEGYFKLLADKQDLTSYSLSSLYQLGLIKQWEADTAAAKNYYNKLISNSQISEETNLVLAAKKRLKEVEDKEPMEHNLRFFMDASLGKEFSGLGMSKVGLRPNIYMPKLTEDINISSYVYLAASGCFNVEVQYLWSGDLGGAEPGVKDPGFNLSYKNPGTKIVGLVLISPTGITDYAFDFVDVR